MQMIDIIKLQKIFIHYNDLRLYVVKGLRK